MEINKIQHKDDMTKVACQKLQEVLYVLQILQKKEKPALHFLSFSVE